MFRQITITGPDAETFLQGQVTQDVNRAADGLALPGAFCTPKGRVICTIWLVRRADGFDVIAPADLTDSLVSRLMMYRLRAKCEISAAAHSLAIDEEVSGRAFNWGPGDGVLEFTRDGDALCVRIDPHTILLFAPEDAGATVDTALLVDDPALCSRLIRAGLVTVGAAVSQKYTPHMLSLDLAGAISFDKGCYTGQEVVARTEHLGRSRRRLMRYVSSSPALCPGNELLCDDQSVGVVVNAGGLDVLAVLPEDLHQKSLRHGETVLRPAPLPWAETAG